MSHLPKRPPDPSSRPFRLTALLALTLIPLAGCSNLSGNLANLKAILLPRPTEDLPTHPKVDVQFVQQNWTPPAAPVVLTRRPGHRAPPLQMVPRP